MQKTAVITCPSLGTRAPPGLQGKLLSPTTCPIDRLNGGFKNGLSLKRGCVIQWKSPEPGSRQTQTQTPAWPVTSHVPLDGYLPLQHSPVTVGDTQMLPPSHSLPSSFHAGFTGLSLTTPHGISRSSSLSPSGTPGTGG